jgi:Icc protein
MSESDAEIDLLQLSDPHLFADPEARHKGYPTLACFRRAVEHALAGGTPDAILLTGDIAEDRSAEAYQTLRETLEPAGCPVYCLPGNHDDPELMRKILTGGAFHYCATLNHGAWMLPMLDTWDGDRGGGRLGTDELQRLDELLRTAAAPHALVCLHHHPVPMGSAWLDEVGLDDADALLSLLRGHGSVRGVLWGHVHQVYDRHHDGIRMMGTPSTCYQFVPGQALFELDDVAPGYRRIRLCPDGRIESRVVRLDR